ncbi:MAG TPA: hypothetical protein VH592_26220 [Gemmataceae bacterium]|jgi:hypothetical protein
MSVVLGCATKPNEQPSASEEGAVREKFAELQSVIKENNNEKLWAMLDTRSQADAEKAAKDIQTAYKQAGAEEKTKQEEALGLKGMEIAELNGKSFLKTKRFQKKYDEVPEGKIENVVVQGESATIHFLEPDGDKEKAILVRQDGQWKVWLTMPKAKKQ